MRVQGKGVEVDIKQERTRHKETQKIFWVSEAGFLQRSAPYWPTLPNTTRTVSVTYFSVSLTFSLWVSVWLRGMPVMQLSRHTHTQFISTPRRSPHVCINTTHWKSVTVERVWLSTVSVLHIYKTKTCVCRAVYQAFLFVRLMVTTGSSVFFCECLVLRVLLAVEFQHHAGSVSFGHRGTLWGAAVS